jgi:hypothetical protein
VEDRADQQEGEADEEEGAEEGAHGLMLSYKDDGGGARADGGRV